MKTNKVKQQQVEKGKRAIKEDVKDQSANKRKK